MSYVTVLSALVPNGKRNNRKLSTNQTWISQGTGSILHPIRAVHRHPVLRAIQATRVLRGFREVRADRAVRRVRVQRRILLILRVPQVPGVRRVQAVPGSPSSSCLLHRDFPELRVLQDCRRVLGLRRDRAVQASGIRRPRRVRHRVLGVRPVQGLRRVRRDRVHRVDT